jgi:phosphoglycolate phosphatase
MRESQKRICASLSYCGILLDVTHSFLDISPELARRLRLVMTDVDGTLTADGEYFDPSVIRSVLQLQATGLIVGLVSGRTLPRLKKVAFLLATNGPLIAENGGLAQLNYNSPPLDLGFSRQPALSALSKLKTAFPGAITEREDNKNRMVDVTIRADGLTVEDLRQVAGDVQISDSGYMVHIMATGISKGKTLLMIMDQINDELLSPEEIIVFGDSPTDISLFQSFPNSVLVHNPQLSSMQAVMMEGIAAYQSNHPIEKGFSQVAGRIVKLRQ